MCVYIFSINKKGGDDGVKKRRFFPSVDVWIEEEISIELRVWRMYVYTNGSSSFNLKETA